MQRKRKKRRIESSKQQKQKFIQYTKKFVTSIMIIACVWVTWSYILATYALVEYGNSDTLIELSKQVVTSIICLGLGYFLKAFFETYCEKKMEKEDVIPQDILNENLEIERLNNYDGMDNE